MLPEIKSFLKLQKEFEYMSKMKITIYPQPAQEDVTAKVLQQGAAQGEDQWHVWKEKNQIYKADLQQKNNRKNII